MYRFYTEMTHKTPGLFPSKKSYLIVKDQASILDEMTPPMIILKQSGWILKILFLSLHRKM